MTIGETIRNIRQVKGLSQKELADICGVSMGAVSAWEQGRNEPRPRILNKIADHFNIPVNMLLHPQSDTLQLLEDTQASDHKFSAQEKRLIHQYRQLSQLGKDTVNAVIHVQLQGQKADYPKGYESTSGFINEPKGLYEQLYKASPEILQEIKRYFQYLQEKEVHKTEK